MKLKKKQKSKDWHPGGPDPKSKKSTKVQNHSEFFPLCLSVSS